MKRQSFLFLMGAVMLALTALVLFADGLPGGFSSVLAFPFEQISAALRALALTGRLGNALALTLCVALSLLPVYPVLRHVGEKDQLGEHIALCCVSITLFFTLFSMADASRPLAPFPEFTQDALPVIKGCMGCAVWSLVVLWCVLKLVRLFRAGDTNQLLRYLRTALYALCILFAAAIPLSCVTPLLDGLSAAQNGTDRLMAALRFVTSALPYLLDIGITLSLLTLLDEYLENKEDIKSHAATLSKRCCLALGVTVTSAAALNVLQLVLSPFLSNISVYVGLPVVSLAFVLLVLLLARMIVENRRLQQDNDLFI